MGWAWVLMRGQTGGPGGKKESAGWAWTRGLLGAAVERKGRGEGGARAEGQPCDGQGEKPWSGQDILEPETPLSACPVAPKKAGSLVGGQWWLSGWGCIPPKLREAQGSRFTKGSARTQWAGLGGWGARGGRRGRWQNEGSMHLVVWIPRRPESEGWASLRPLPSEKLLDSSAGSLRDSPVFPTQHTPVRTLVATLRPDDQRASAVLPVRWEGGGCSGESLWGRDQREKSPRGRGARLFAELGLFAEHQHRLSRREVQR